MEQRLSYMEMTNFDKRHILEVIKQVPVLLIVNC